MADGGPQPTSPSEVALRTTIGEIEAHRARALAKLEAAFDALQEAMLAAGRAVPSRRTAINIPDKAGKALVGTYSFCRDTFIAEMRQEIDRSVWGHLLDHMGLEPLMDAQARAEFRRGLEKDPPEATAANCFATMRALVEDSGLIFRRGIANAFSKLDRRFRSHDGFKIGTRIVLSHAFSDWGGWGRDHDATLFDVERVFRVLDGQPVVDRYAGIVGLCDAHRRQRPFEVESEYFRVVAYKNGNAHVWFKRADLVKQVNKLLAEYYGDTLGAAPDCADVKHAPKTGVAKNYGFFETPPSLAAEIVAHAIIEPGMTVLEPSAGRGALAREAAKAGGVVTCVEIQRGHADDLLAERLGDVMCEDFLGIDPRVVRSRFDRIVMNPPFDQGRDIDHVMHALDLLKPDGVLVAIMSAGAEFREDAKSLAFRKRVESLGGRFRDLPPGSFKESGTMVNTVCLAIGRGKYW